MEIGIVTNDKNQVELFFFDDENGTRVNINEETLDGIKEGNLYKYIDGNFIRDTPREQYIQNFIQIDELKKKLSDTDYVVTKTMEYQITGKPIPTNYNQIIVDRDSWREQIKTFQNEMEELES